MWTTTYILSIVLVNWLFVVVPPLGTPVGELNLATLVVGAVFVLRDYAQREVGHKVLAATLTAGIVTWFMTSPELAIASLTAFFISEMADWAVFSFTKRPLQNRILISSLISIPLDSFAFLYLSGFLTGPSFTVETMSKAVGVLIVWLMLRARVKETPASAA